MANMTGADEKNTINGKYGVVEINGYEMLRVEKLEVNAKINREKIKGTGHRANKSISRMTDTEYDGSCKVTQVSNLGMREYIRNVSKGIDEPAYFHVYNVDPNAYEGQVESASFEAYFTDLPLIGWENGKILEKEFKFDVSEFDYDSIIDAGEQLFEEK